MILNKVLTVCGLKTVVAKECLGSNRLIERTFIIRTIQSTVFFFFLFFFSKPTADTSAALRHDDQLKR